jgi:hypothetical protein
MIDFRAELTICRKDECQWVNLGTLSWGHHSYDYMNIPYNNVSDNSIVEHQKNVSNVIYINNCSQDTYPNAY